MDSVLSWLLELLIGTGPLLWGLKKLPVVLVRLPPHPVTPTQRPLDDTPEVLQGSIAGFVVFALWLTAGGYYSWPISTLDGFIGLCGFPLMGGLVQQRLTRFRSLSANHPCRVEAESLASKAGMLPVKVLLTQSYLPYTPTRNNTIVLTTRAVREFSVSELRFLIALSLWEVRGGKSHSDQADQFALGLSRDFMAAQSALLRLYKLYDYGQLPAVAPVSERIERLANWWQAQQPQAKTTSSVTLHQRISLP